MRLATKTEAGIAEYSSDADYHADRKRLSGTALDLFAENPRRFAAWQQGKWEQATTDAMRFGTLFHALALEPDTVKARFAVEPEDPERPGKCIRRNRNDYKEWRAEQDAAGLVVVKPEDMAKLDPIVSALGECPDVMDLLTCEGGMNEVALHWNIEGNGRPMRAKLDRIIPDRDIIVELKTTASANPENERNLWSWYGFGYHRKAWLYLDAYEQVFGRKATMVHIFVESDSAHPQVFWSWSYVDSPAVQCGEIETLELLGQLQRCEEAGDFRKPWEPGAPGEQVRALPLPGPIVSKMEFVAQTPALTMGGEPV